MRLLLALALLAAPLLAPAAPPFELRDGDRVLLLGDTLIEREATHGALEARLHEQFPAVRFTVRNLSWSADTPLGVSRASFDPPVKGWERLKEQIAIVRPTVVFLGYGMAASLMELGGIADPTRYGAEPMSAARFKNELAQLMVAIEQSGGQGVKGEGVAAGGAPVPPSGGAVRFVLLSPIRHEDLRAARPGLPDPAPHNALLERYSKAIEELAKERGARFVGTFTRSGERGPIFPGDPRQEAENMANFTANGIHLTDIGYSIWADGCADSLGWVHGRNQSAQERKARWRWVQSHLVPAIQRKNALVFHRFRPENYTYLFGFRKHEQGQNAKEIPAFDPLIDAAEAEIDRLKRGSGGEQKATPQAAAGDPGTGPGVPAAQEAKRWTVELLAGADGRTTFSVERQPFPNAAAVVAEVRRRLGGDPEGGVRVQAARAVTYAELKELLDGFGAAGVKRLTVAMEGGADAAPAEPLPKFDVLEGYEITLWADNPLLEKPVQMNWDAQGRLWVASSNTYPQVDPADMAVVLAKELAASGAPAHAPDALGMAREFGASAANDKILVLEDTDADGRADKSTVFAEGLLIPTGVVPASGGGGATPTVSACYVGQSTELLRLTDTDGDGRADRREIILSGLGTEDTHHLVHTLKWGPDGRLYFNQSIYIHSHLETPWGVVRQNSGGVLAWDPRTERVEVLFNGFCNPWGHQWDRWGQSFVTDGAGFQGVTWGVPGAMYFTYENGRKILQSVSPGSYPKFCGLEIVASPHFPAEWQGDAVTCDFRAHRIVRFRLNDLGEGDRGAKAGGLSSAPGGKHGSDAGSKPSPLAPRGGGGAAEALSGYITSELPDLVRTSDIAFRPIDVRHGPDGALYVADWSNPVINHGEVDFRDPRRDKRRGRIWRIARRGAPPVPWEPLVAAESAALLAKAVSEHGWEAEQARQLLARREPEEVRAALEKWTLDVGLAGDARADALVRRETLWLHQALGLPTHPALWQLAQEGLPQLRALAARGYGAAYAAMAPAADAAARRERDDHALAELKGLLADSHPRVRLEAMRAAARIPSARAAALVLEAAVAAPAKDAHYEYAAWLSINDLAGPWAQAAAAGAWRVDSPERERQLEFALGAVDPAVGAPVLAKALEGRELTGAGPWIELIGKAGGAGELRALFDALHGQRLDPAASERALTALREAARLRNARPAGDLAPVATLLSHGNVRISANAARLLGIWRAKGAGNLLRELAGGGTRGDAPLELRMAAVEGLRELGGKEAVAALRELTRNRPAAGVPREAAVALAALDAAGSHAEVFAVLGALTEEKELVETWRALVTTKGAADALAAALGQPGALTPPAAAAGVRVSRELGGKGKALLAALAPIAGVKAGEAAAPAVGFAAVAELVKRDGDPARGEEVYRRAQLACVTCHAIGGAGGKVGPELTSMGASAPLDYIIESVIAPAAKVKEGYHAVSVTLKDGTVAMGTPARETGEELFLRTVAGTEVAVVKANIAGRELLGSIMPAGLVDGLKERERLDLYAFLGQLGRPGVYDASKGTVARYWALYPGASVDEVLRGEAAGVPAAPGFAQVDGNFTRELLAAALPAVPAAGGTVLAVARFQVPVAGRITVNLLGATKAWLDGKPLSGPLELAAGEHTLAVKLDTAQLPAALRAEAEGVRWLGN